MPKTLITAGATLGCDPELFLARRGKIVGSERVIPEKIEVPDRDASGYLANGGLGGVAVVRDGVQVELHPKPFACRANLSDSLKLAFQTLDKHLKSLPTEYEANFDPLVRVTKLELNRLSPASRVLGCQPSFNLYGLLPIDVEGLVQTRVAGGHIHIGLSTINHPGRNNAPDGIQAEELIRLMDIVVGNIGVLLTRGDVNERKRRKMYGRAGEYRLPNHGVEYRTLSNFWLRSYPLFSLITGLTHEVVNIANTASKKITQQYFARGGYGYKTDTYAIEAQRQLFEAVKTQNIVKAIQNNDYDLAAENYRAIRPILADLQWHQGVNSQNVTDFDYFVDKGLDHWWDPAKGWNAFRHWCDKPDGHGNGWEAFASTKVAPERLRDTGWKNPFVSALPPATPNVADLRRAA
jgi:hypothetical protein